MRKQKLWNNALRKATSLSLCVAMVVSLSACSDGTSSNNEPESSPESGTEATVEEGAASLTPKEETYYSDYNTMTEVYEAGLDLNKEITAEGYVLLKNAESLPLEKESKVSVFGKNSSGVADALKKAGFDVNPELETFYADNALSGEGANTANDASFWATGETPQSSYTDTVKNSYGSYGKTAVVVFARSGGEGSDLPRASFAETEGQATASVKYPTRSEIESGTWTPVGGMGRESDPFEHYLELDDHEEALLAMLEENDAFDNVVVLLNSSYAMEVNFLNDGNYSKVKSCIWLTGTGANGLESVGGILDGDINPSGRTPDILQSDFTEDPTWSNFANNLVGNETDGFAAAKGNEYTLDDGTVYKDSLDLSYYEVSYEEGIYNGYHYYETRGFTDGDEWYENHVVYPFGYGLSYTDFEWEIVDFSPESDSALSADGTITVDVKVTNRGMVAGKDVVQLYYEAPYIKSGIEKSKVELGDFAKTQTLEPGESETVTLSIVVADMKSYDYNDANGNGFVGYEVEGGDYKFYISEDSHSWADGDADVINYTVNANGFTYGTDEVTGNEVTNQFDYINAEMSDRILTRGDWTGTWPSRPLWYDVIDATTVDPMWAAWYRTQHNGTDWTDADTSVTPVYLAQGEAELVKDKEWLDNYEMPLEDQEFTLETSYDESNSRYPDENGNSGKAPWYSEEAPTFRAEEERYTEENPAPIQLSDLKGLNYDDPKWDEFLNQFSVKQEVEQLITAFNFVPNKALGIPNSTHGDGPFGIQRAFDLIAYLQPGDMMESDQLIKFASQVALTASFNKELAHEYGVLNGDFGLWAKLTGWYSPGINIHRTPFSGRNNNYCSEDAVLTGKIVANVSRGCASKGMVTFLKHYALNDQETNRDTTGVATWADEQTIRQVYLKPFEMAVKEGESLGMMTSFNRVGFDWAGASYELLTGIARDEWGYAGIYITDAAGTTQASNYMNANMMIRAGNDLSLDGVPGQYKIDEDTGIPTLCTGISSTDKANTATHLTALNDSVHRTLFTVLQTASMMNGHTMFPVDYNVSANDLETNFGEITNADSLVRFEAKTGSQAEFDVTDKDLTDVKYVLYAGKLPEGLSLDQTTGIISGTVADTVEPGTFRITIGVCDSDIEKGEEWTASVVNYFNIVIE